MTLTETLAAQLADAQADLALKERLATVEQRIADLTTAYDAAVTAEADDAAQKAAASREASMEGLSAIEVTPTQFTDGGETSYRISWDEPAWDAGFQASPITRRTVWGLGALPVNVLHYLIDKQPEQIPPAIMALAPGDPAAAIAAHLA